VRKLGIIFGWRLKKAPFIKRHLKPKKGKDEKEDEHDEERWVISYRNGGFQGRLYIIRDYSQGFNDWYSQKREAKDEEF